MPTPEELARVNIDKQLEAAGWIVQDFKALNLGAGPGVAVREFQTADGSYNDVPGDCVEVRGSSHERSETGLRGGWCD